VIALAIHYGAWLALAMLIGVATGWWTWGPRRGEVEADEPIAWPPPKEAAVPVLAPPVLAADDLTAIKGIDVEIAGRLRDLGITRFSQIAGWLPADIERVDAALGPFKGRLIRDEWIAQARLLARGDIETYHQRFGCF